MGASGAHTVRELATKLDFEKLSTPSHLTYGTAIAQRGGVEIIEERDDVIEAWAGGLDGTTKEGGGQRRRARLSIKDGELVARCGNGPEQERWCKHTIAIARFLT